MELSVSLLLVAGTDSDCAMNGDCSGCTIGDDDTENYTGGTSIVCTPISDGLVLSLSAIESLRMLVPEALTSPSTEELLRRPGLVPLYSPDQTWKDSHNEIDGDLAKPRLLGYGLRHR